MKKGKVLEILATFFNFQNHSKISKRKYFDAKSALQKLQKIASKRHLGMLNSYAGQKDIVNYITSRNMRKTLLPSDLKRVIGQPEMSALNIKHILQSGLLGSLISKEPEGDFGEQSDDHPDQWGGPESYKSIRFIKVDFQELINNNPSVLILFYAYWCRHCSRMKIPYGKAALMAKEAGLDVVFAAFDVTANPELADELGVVGIPTTKYFKNGKFVTNYRGQRTADDLFEFVKSPPQPITSDKKPADI